MRKKETKAELGAKEVISKLLRLRAWPIFGPFSRVGGDDRLIDKVNLR